MSDWTGGDPPSGGATAAEAIRMQQANALAEAERQYAIIAAAGSPLEPWYRLMKVLIAEQAQPSAALVQATTDVARMLIDAVEKGDQ